MGGLVAAHLYHYCFPSCGVSIRKHPVIENKNALTEVSA